MIVINQIEAQTIARNLRDNMRDLDLYQSRTLYYRGFSVTVHRNNADNFMLVGNGITSQEAQPIFDAMPLKDDGE